MTTKKWNPKQSSKTIGKGPSEIAPKVFVGGWNDAVKFEGARFCVLDELPEGMPTGTHIPIYNESANRASVKELDRLASAMEAAHATGKPVLVYCGHGVMRSPLGAAWFLKRSEGLSLERAYARVEAVRPKIKRASIWVGNADELEQA